MAAMGQEPEPAGGEPAGTPEAPGQFGGERKGVDPGKVVDTAVKAEEALEDLATQLAKGDAPEQVVKAISQMAKGVRQIVKAIDKAPVPDPEPTPAPRSIGDATNELAANARQPR